MLYVLDEPTIGLHPRDNARLLGALKRLRDLGNTLVLVEHDREVIDAADHLVDFGPGSGDFGGEVTADGHAEEGPKPRPHRSPAATSAARWRSPCRRNRRGRPDGRRSITIRGARHHNLRDVDAVVPGRPGHGGHRGERVGQVVARRGHPGEGRREDAAPRGSSPGSHDGSTGLSTSTRSSASIRPRSAARPRRTRPRIRALFDLDPRAVRPDARGEGPRLCAAAGSASTWPAAGARRARARARSGSRCTSCPTSGSPCEACGGSRYTPETLAVKFRGKSIADVLDMTVDAALDLFAGVPKIRRVLQTLHDVGLGYVRLGQAGPTLSGGEAQRVKLAAELARPDTGRTLYVLDEPTTGLHLDDVKKLLAVVHRLADLGNTVVIIEHNLEVIKTSDWVIDIGPEAGADGGRIVAEGTPEAVAAGRGQPHRRDPQGQPGREPARGPAEVRPEGRREEDPRRGAGTPTCRTTPKPPWKIDGRGLAHPRPRHEDRQAHPMGRRDRRDASSISSRHGPLRAGRLVREGRRDGSRARTRRRPPFLEILTGHEWIVTLRFRRPRAKFKARALEARLGLKPFHEAEKPVLSDAPRLSAEQVKGTTSIEITAHSAEDLATPAFAEFLRDAAASTRAAESASTGDGRTVARSARCGDSQVAAARTGRWRASRPET